MPLRSSTLSPRHALPLLMSLSAAASLLGLPGCAGNKPPATPPSVAVAAPRPMETPIESAATQAVPDRAPLQAAPLTANPDPSSYAYRDDARALALALSHRQQLDPEWTRAVLAQARVNDSVTRLIMPAATPAAKNWAAYRTRFIEPIRVRAGAAFWRANEATLRRAEATYGVPMEIIAGIIGVETVYGRNTGNIRVLDALATLSLDFPKGRSDRSAYFQDELGQFLRLCADQQIDPTTVLGSFAGAIGLPQFMPGSIRRFAVDFDGDGHIDLRNNAADAIGSVAQYLAQNGWQRGMPTHYAVQPPADAASRDRLLGPDILPSFTAVELQQSGATLEPAGQAHSGLLALVVLYNAGAEPTYIAGTDNFYAVTRYNQSSYYALAVIELGQAVARAAITSIAAK